LENLSDGVYFVDLERRIRYWNKGAERLSGYSASEVLGRRCKDRMLNHCDDAGRILCGKHCPLLATIRDGQHREAHVYLHHKDGHRRPVRVHAAPLRDSDGVIVGAVETFSDDSALIDMRRRADDLQRTSMSDSLTGVGNRRLGETVLAGWVEQHVQSGRSFGVLFVDIDHFKDVNDEFGHEIGDDALKVIARTLTDTSRHQDEVVRWGGEEFLVLLADADHDALATIAERARVLVHRARLFAGRRLVPLSISIGGTLVAPGDSPQLIVRRADALLYDSKTAGRNRVTLDRDNSPT
jgi:diguanylate cyclase (GGDEF)-like protein/PAS domain S-box-containing protein